MTKEAYKDILHDRGLQNLEVIGVDGSKVFLKINDDKFAVTNVKHHLEWRKAPYYKERNIEGYKNSKQYQCDWRHMLTYILCYPFIFNLKKNNEDYDKYDIAEMKLNMKKSFGW